jgi:hypothetical protein
MVINCSMGSRPRGVAASSELPALVMNLSRSYVERLSLNISAGNYGRKQEAWLKEIAAQAEKMIVSL